MRPLHVRGMGGLGDCVYARPLIRHFLDVRGELWLSTPYPELYEDLAGVYPVRWKDGGLRCQSKNMARHSGTWVLPPKGAERVRLMYALGRLNQTIVAELEQGAQTAIHRFRFDLPDFGSLPIGQRYAVVRPVSVRKEWRNTARNPDPRYVFAAAQSLIDAGFRVVCVGDIDGENETLEGTIPPAHDYWTGGELTTRELFALVANASVVVGGVGWIVPTCLAYRTPCVVIGGGLGSHNSPDLIVDRRMNRDRISFVLPEPYCHCRDPRHACPKTIPDFAERFADALEHVLRPIRQEAA